MFIHFVSSSDHGSSGSSSAEDGNQQLNISVRLSQSLQTLLLIKHVPVQPSDQAVFTALRLRAGGRVSAVMKSHGVWHEGHCRLQGLCSVADLGLWPLLCNVSGNQSLSAEICPRTIWSRFTPRSSDPNRIVSFAEVSKDKESLQSERNEGELEQNTVGVCVCVCKQGEGRVGEWLKWMTSGHQRSTI